jgi:hypothetical protein
MKEQLQLMTAWRDSVLALQHRLPDDMKALLAQEPVRRHLLQQHGFPQSQVASAPPPGDVPGVPLSAGPWARAAPPPWS